MGILGIYASQISGHLMPASDYESISTVTVGAGGSSTISFTSIPSTYKHLQIRGMNLSSSSVNYVRARFNSDSGNNYARHLLEGSGASAGAERATAISYAAISYTGSNSNPCIFITDILDYQNTNKYKVTKSLWGIDQNGSGYMDFGSALWLDLSSISSIELTHTGGINFAENSHFALYGLKG